MFFYREVREPGSSFPGTIDVWDMISRVSLAQLLQALGSFHV